jgi:uncharacterized protein (TIGR00730 family)
MTKKITVFGSSLPKPGQPAYEEALILGRNLGSFGWTVLTGGYIGTMEAVSKGARDAGGHVVGITCDEIENWREVGANPWVQEELRTEKIHDRVRMLIEKCDAAIALPGGIGTLTEVALMWTMLSIDVIDPKPLILVGPAWKRTLHTFYQEQTGYISYNNFELLSFATDVEMAISYLKSVL